MKPKNPVPDIGDGFLQKCSPEIFYTEDRTHKEFYSCILTLSLIYNDFKDLNWWMLQLEKGAPIKSLDPKERFTYDGEFNGMANHVHRLFIGLLNELLVFIAKNAGIWEAAPFKHLLETTHPNTRRAWENLYLLSQGKVAGKDFGKDILNYLQRLRSNGIFHYHQTEGISQSYKYFFAQKDFPNEFAYFMTKDSMEATRFFFADAAAQGSLLIAKEDLPSAKQEHISIDVLRDKYFGQLNQALYGIVVTFIRIRSKELKNPIS